MTMPSEERVMRARVECIETVPIDHPFSDEETPPIWRVVMGEYCADFDYEQAARNFAGAINDALAFSDEGSGIGELREALRPYLQHRVDCRNRQRLGQRHCSCGLTDILTTSFPDIDRSGLAQEVEG